MLSHKSMVNNKVPNVPSPASESSDSEPLCLRLAKAHFSNAHHIVDDALLGDGKPLLVDNHQ
jgi:hypothetical protein